MFTAISILKAMPRLTGSHHGVLDHDDSVRALRQRSARVDAHHRALPLETPADLAHPLWRRRSDDRVSIDIGRPRRRDWMARIDVLGEDVVV